MIDPAAILAWLFIHPLELPPGARLWMLLPLVACVATVYRATRIQRTRGMARAATWTSINILVGMTLIAAAFYLIHLFARRFL